MLSGRKTATSRTKRMGLVGDQFEAFGATFQIAILSNWSLASIANVFYILEGFESREEFIECWKLIHPRKGYDPEQRVWLHIFKRVEK